MSDLQLALWCNVIGFPVIYGLMYLIFVVGCDCG